jgi:hypothetical protein
VDEGDNFSYIWGFPDKNERLIFPGIFSFILLYKIFYKNKHINNVVQYKIGGTGLERYKTLQPGIPSLLA